VDPLLTCWCFDPDSIDGTHVGSLIRHGLGFTPTHVRLGRKTSDYSESILRRLDSSAQVMEVRVQTDTEPGGPYFQVVPIGTWRFQAVYWRVPATDVPSLATLEQLTGLPGFNAGYRCAEADVFWQSEANIATYEQRRRSHSGLRKTEDRTFGGMKIDISGNPGRRVPYPGMWLQSCWQMWFGSGAFKRLPFSRLRDFTEGVTCSVLPSGAVFVQLYDDPFAYDTPDSRRLQARFRDWSGMNELERGAMGDAERVADPTFEMSEGAFPHGGVRLITDWRDAQGRPTRRSQASHRVDVELGPTGLEVWREERHA
jgi:hypothetical protein